MALFVTAMRGGAEYFTLFILIILIMNQNYKLAIDALKIRRSILEKAAEGVLVTIKLVLKRVGEHGVSLAPLDYTDGIRVPVAEHEPQQFFPITRIRYWKGKLEVFVSNYRPCEKGWEILPSGQWIGFAAAHADLPRILDAIMANLEYADGYADSTDD